MINAIYHGKKETSTASYAIIFRLIKMTSRPPHLHITYHCHQADREMRHVLMHSHFCRSLPHINQSHTTTEAHWNAFPFPFPRFLKTTYFHIAPARAPPSSRANIRSHDQYSTRRGLLEFKAWWVAVSDRLFETGTLDGKLVEWIVSGLSEGCAQKGGIAPVIILIITSQSELMETVELFSSIAVETYKIKDWELWKFSLCLKGCLYGLMILKFLSLYDFCYLLIFSETIERSSEKAKIRPWEAGSCSLLLFHIGRMGNGILNAFVLNEDDWETRLEASALSYRT